MRTIMICCAILLSTFLSSSLAAENELHISRFSAGDLTGWKEQTIWNAKKTRYSFVPNNGKITLMAKSSNTASGLIRKIETDPKAYPFIKWSWKIDNTVKNANERVKDGHDFAARLYVVFSRGLFSRTRAIEYVWGNVMHKGESLINPYSSSAVMIAVDAGEEQLGQWTSHKRNYYEDYRTAFGEEAPKVGAIAIMTDSDNTHESAVAYYGDISLLAATKDEDQKSKEPKNKEAAPKEQPHKDQHKKDILPKEKPNGTQPITPYPASQPAQSPQ